MITDVLRITAAAFYGTVAQEFDDLTRDTDFDETVRFITALSARVAYRENGNIIIEPILGLPKGNTVITMANVSRRNAFIFLGEAANIGFTLRFPDLEGGGITRSEANLMSASFHGVLQFGLAPNGFIATSANMNESNGFTAREPAEFAAGVLLTMPLSGVDSVFHMGKLEGNELLETACERLARYGLVTKRKKDEVYTDSMRREKRIPKRRAQGRPKKIPDETEPA